MKIEQLGDHINDYNKNNGTNFIIYNEDDIYKFYYDGYNNGSRIYNNINEFTAYIDGYLKALEIFKTK